MAMHSESSVVNGTLSKHYGSIPVHLALIFMVGLISYCNTFDVPFHFDDYGYIVENPFIKESRLLSSQPPPDAAEFSINVIHTHKTRLIGYLSFLLNYRLHGLEVAGYHAINLALHIINAVLIYFLVTSTFKTPHLSSSSLRERSLHVALFSSLLFISHPVHTEAVTYISQRFTALVALFYLLSLFLYIQSRLQGANASSRLLYALSLVSAVLAMKTKENAFTLPLAIALYEFVFFDDSARKRALLLAPFLLTMLIVPLSLVDFKKPLLETFATLPSYNIGLPRLKYLLVESRVLVTYLRLLVFPFNQNLDYDYFKFSPLFLVEMICALVFLMSLLLAAAYAFKRFRHSRLWTRLAFYGALWFFLTISVESTMIPLDDLIFEHRLYLPSAFLFIVFVSGSAHLYDCFLKKRYRPLLPVLAVLIIAALSTATLARNRVWRSETRIWEDIVRKSPKKARAHFALGFMYADAGRSNEAINQYRTAIRLNPYYVEPRRNLAQLYYNLGRLDEARRELEELLNIAPGNEEAIFFLEQIKRLK